MIYGRIKQLCSQKGLTITGLEKELGFARGSLSKIDTNKPSSDRLQKVADRLGVSTRYLLTGEEDLPDDAPEYYYDADVRDFAQFLYQNPDYKVLFDASRKVKKEDIEFIKNMIDRAAR